MAKTGEVLVLGGSEVDALLDPGSCIRAVEEAFRDRGRGADAPTGVLGFHAADGGFHLKAAAAPGWRYFAAKLNANFPDNPRRRGLPTIQGIVVLFDGVTGSPLAVIDSVRITALRTAAASAVAARYLARPEASRLFIVGCGTQAMAHIDAIRAVRSVERVAVYDSDPARAMALVSWAERRGVTTVAERGIAGARESDMIVTCTPSRSAFLGLEHVSPGAFVAAVGADNEQKQEIHPALMGCAKVVVDSREQCVTMGDTRGAIAAGSMIASGIHADLSEIVSGSRVGRSSEGDVVVFDSTGVALEDVAAAGAVYEAALRTGRGAWIRFSGDRKASGDDTGVLANYRFLR